jgi:isoleucyl-tRNA synthetase
VFIVSQVELTSASDLAIEVLEPQGSKCGRCWNYRSTVGAAAEHPELCAPCLSVVSAAAA